MEGLIGEDFDASFWLFFSFILHRSNFSCCALSSFFHCGSFNLLVPVSGCSAGIDQYEEYVTARGALHSLPLTNLTTISAATSGQSCDTFGVNNKFSYLAQLYNEGDALFLANTGLLSKHLTKYDDWNDETSFQLFAHNTMIVRLPITPFVLHNLYNVL